MLSKDHLYLKDAVSHSSAKKEAARKYHIATVNDRSKCGKPLNDLSARPIKDVPAEQRCTACFHPQWS